MDNNLSKKEIILISIVVIFVVLPLLIFIVLQVVGLVRDAFGIESTETIKGKQEVIINNLESERKIEKQIHTVKQRAKEIETNVTIKISKERIKTEKTFDKLKVTTKIKPKEEKRIMKEVHLLKHKTILPKKDNNKTEKETKVIYINKKTYEETGYRNICNIWKAYEIVKDEK